MSAVESEHDERIFDLIGGGMAVTTAVALAAAGYFVFESAVYGAVAGLFVGIGSYLFLPWFLRLSAVQEGSDEEVSGTAAVERVSGNPQTSVLGAGLEMGGIAMFAAGFVTEKPDLLVGVPAAIAVALAVFLVGSVLLPE